MERKLEVRRVSIDDAHQLPFSISKKKNTAKEEFDALCFEFGIELDDVVSWKKGRKKRISEKRGGGGGGRN